MNTYPKPPVDVLADLASIAVHMDTGHRALAEHYASAQSVPPLVEAMMRKALEVREMALGAMAEMPARTPADHVAKARALATCVHLDEVTGDAGLAVSLIRDLLAEVS